MLLGMATIHTPSAKALRIAGVLCRGKAIATIPNPVLLVVAATLVIEAVWVALLVYLVLSL